MLFAQSLGEYGLVAGLPQGVMRYPTFPAVVVTVSRVQTDTGELVTGVWNDGRIGTFRGLRPPGKRGYGAFVFGTKGMAQSGSYAGYTPLVERIAEFFHTHKLPVSNEETIELYAFMEAADESKRQGGKPVSMKDVIDKAREKALKSE